MFLPDVSIIALILTVPFAQGGHHGGSCVVKDCNRSFPNGAIFIDFFSCNRCRCHRTKLKCTKMLCPQDPCMLDDICYTFGELMHNGEMCSIQAIVKHKAITAVGQRDTGANKPVLAVDTVVTADDAKPADCEIIECKRTYKHGVSFTDFFSCNLCKCDEGRVLCTKIMCPREPCMHNGVCYSDTEVMANGDVCTVKALDTTDCEIKECGRTFSNGETFKDFFSCNNCECNQGRPKCSTVMCPQEPCLFHDVCYNDGEVMPDGYVCSIESERKKKKYEPTDCELTDCKRRFKDGVTFHDFYSCNSCYCRSGLVTCTNDKKKCPQEPCRFDYVCYSDGEVMPNKQRCRADKPGQTRKKLKIWDL